MKSKLKKWFFAGTALAVALAPVSTGTATEISNDEKSVVSNQSNGNAYAPDRVIIKYKSDAAAKTFHAKTKVDIKEELPLIEAEVVAVPKDQSVPDFINKLEKDPNVEYAQPDYLLHAQSTHDDHMVHAQALPNDPEFKWLWGLHDPLSGFDIDAPQAWDITQGNPNIVVGIIDSGIKIDHPDLVNNIWRNQGEIPNNGQDDDGNGFIDDVNGWDFFHNDNTVFDTPIYDTLGTFLAGIIAATGNNNIGVIGVAPKVKVMPLKVLGPGSFGSTTNVIRAIQYARDKGVKILNINTNYSITNYDQAFKDAIEASNALIVTEAGLGGIDIDTSPRYPASFDSSNILSVVALGSNGNLFFNSNFGKEDVDVAAPGSPIYSTTSNDSYGYASSTTMAAAYTAGTAALLLSLNPNLTPEMMIDIIKTTGTPLAALQNKVNSGKLINAFNALNHVPPTNPMKTVYEDNDPSIVYSGKWQNLINQTYSNGTAKESSFKGALTFQFTGAEIEWIGYKSPTQGTANVYIDGVLVEQSSLYAPTLQTQQSIFKRTLPTGQHTIKIEWAGKPDPRGNKLLKNINVDSLIVTTP